MWLGVSESKPDALLSDKEKGHTFFHWILASFLFHIDFLQNIEAFF